MRSVRGLIRYARSATSPRIEELQCVSLRHLEALPLTRYPALRRALALAGMFVPLAALAQRADENAVTAADDAFGPTIGSQSIGLYDAEHVRGFSPRAAGNLRIEGLYFDQQTFAMNECLVTGATIRVAERQPVLPRAAKS